MQDNKTFKQAFRHVTLTFLMLSFFSLTVLSQVTKQQLDNFYQNNQQTELEQIFHRLHKQSQSEVSKLSNNDTLKRISNLFILVLPNRQKHEPTLYYFLQPNFPKTYVNDKELTLTGNFIAPTTFDNLKPIIYDSQTVNEILKFIGSNPYDHPTVKEYLKDKRKMSKSKIKEAESLINEHKNKLKFIGQFLLLPASWGKMDRSLVPYTINSLKFNSDLTKVEIVYDMTWRGATEIYKLADGKWEHERTIVMWAD